MTQIIRQTIRPVKLNHEIAISLNNVGKKYTVHHEKPTLVENIERVVRFQKKEEFWALQNVNVKIHKGERIGIIGCNGSGKTTLLKIIAGITKPTTGKLTTTGRIISLIDLEAGFHPDMSGQENIFLNGLVLGMSKQEIAHKFADIVNFAGIGNFITAPLYTYSSGMKLRLGFSVAIHANADILLLDEVLNLGDENFKRQSATVLEQMMQSGITVIIVSQWFEYLTKHCDTILKIS